MKLPIEVKTKWIEALRSGKYQQTKGTMYNPETKSFCCLGVLEHEMLDGEVELNYGIKYMDPPDPAYLYAGLPSCKFWDSIGLQLSEEDKYIHPSGIGDKVFYYDGGLISELACMNDDGLSFKDIAEVIEDQVESY